MKRFIKTLLLILPMALPGMAQTTYRPFEQSTPVVWGQGFGENAPTRFPASAQAVVPADVWSNSQRSSGLQVRFITNSASITVHYTLAGKYSNNAWYSDMGANGLDLYLRKPDGMWHWVYPAQRTVGEVFTYSQLSPGGGEHAQGGDEFCLYLPPFAHLKTLSITVDAGAEFEFIPVTAQKPVVVYGTSIVHGAVCSRPGNTWTNILSRYMPGANIVNMGFSGVGRMEESVVGVLNQIDAEVFVLDCLPNMTSSDLLGQIVTRYKKAVAMLRASHPDAKILLTEHPGYADESMYLTRRLQVIEANNNLKKAYNELLKAGYEQVYYLSRDELGLDMAFHLADYIHPNDAGMYRYADAYAQKLDEITAQTEILDSRHAFTLLSIDAENGLSSGQYSLLNLMALIRNNNPDIVALQDVDFRTADISGKDLVSDLTYRLIQNGQRRQGAFTPVEKRSEGEKGLGLIRRDCFEGTEKIELAHGLVLHTMSYTLQSDVQITIANCRFASDEAAMLLQAEALAAYGERLKQNTVIAASVPADTDSETIKKLETKFRRSCRFNTAKTYPAQSSQYRYAYVLTPLRQSWATESVEIVGDESVSNHKGILIKLGLRNGRE